MTKLRNLLTGIGLVGSLVGCSNSTLRMDTQECPGIYAEGFFRPGRHVKNYVKISLGDTSITLIDDTGKTLSEKRSSKLDWNQDNVKESLRKDHIDAVRIKSTDYAETITPADSNSNTLSGRRARDWLIKGDSLYRATRECFVDWARRDYLKTHPLPSASFR